jgi:hypothetical protein
MGRTVPSFRIALYLEQRYWADFRRALDTQGKLAFDQVFAIARLYISACMMVCRPIRLESIMMSIIFHHYKKLVQIMQEGFEVEHFSKR